MAVRASQIAFIPYIDLEGRYIFSRQWEEPLFAYLFVKGIHYFVLANFIIVS